MFHVRDYKPSDLDEIYAIDQECFEPGIAYSREELQFYMKRKGAFTVIAETNDDDAKPRIAGFTVVEFHAKGFGHVITIDVVQQFRRTGLGTILMKAGEDQVIARNGRLMILEVAVNNLAAIKFYKRHGYIVVKTIPRYYNNELDALLMTKKLPASESKK